MKLMPAVIVGFFWLLSFNISERQITAPPPTTAEEVVSLEGRVVNALTGEPVPRANLTLTIFSLQQGGVVGSGQPAKASAVSDAEGKFKFENLPPGNYLLSVDTTGYVRLSYGNLPGERSPRGAPGDKIKGIEFKLTPQAVISGRVLNEYGEPMSGVQVQLLRQSGYFRRSRIVSGDNTNALGEFLIGGLMPGKYIARADVRRMGFPPPVAPQTVEGKVAEGYVPTYYPRGIQQDTATALSLNAGQHLSAIEIRLQKAPVFRIRGKLLELDNPAPGQSRSGPTELTLESQDSSREEFAPGGSPAAPRGELNRDGTFEFTGVQAGSYYINARRLGQGWPITMRVPVVVVNADVNDLTLPISPPFLTEVSGHIRMEGDGQPPVQASVGLQRADGPVGIGIQPARIEPDGTFKIQRVPPDRYYVTLIGPGDGTYMKHVLAGGVDLLATGLDLSQPQAAPSLDVVLSAKSATIQGTVLRDDKPWPGAVVTLLPDPMKPALLRLLKTANTDASGRFTLKGITPGDYRLYAWAESIMVVNLSPEELRPYDANAVSVSVAEGAQMQVELTLEPLP